MDSLKAGYYLRPELNYNTVQFTVYRKNDFTTHIVNLQDLKILEVRDMKGNIVNDANVTLGQKSVSYDTDMKGYVLPDFMRLQAITD